MSYNPGNGYETLYIQTLPPNKSSSSFLNPNLVFLNPNLVLLNPNLVSPGVLLDFLSFIAAVDASLLARAERFYKFR